MITGATTIQRSMRQLRGGAAGYIAGPEANSSGEAENAMDTTLRATTDSDVAGETDV